MDAGSSSGINPDGRSKLENQNCADNLRSVFLPIK